MIDSGGFAYINPAMFAGAIAQDVNSTEAETMAAVQNPFNISIFDEKSGPPAWKHLPTWYQISENDQGIPPDVQCTFAKQMTTSKFIRVNLCYFYFRIIFSISLEVWIYFFVIFNIFIHIEKYDRACTISEQ